MDVNSLPKTVTRQRRDCDLNPGPSPPESSTLTTRLPSYPVNPVCCKQVFIRGGSERGARAVAARFEDGVNVTLSGAIERKTERRQRPT